MAEDTDRFVTFKAIQGNPVVAWPEYSWLPMSEEEDHDAAFVEFPNISTPTNLISAYEKLGEPPLWICDSSTEAEDIQKPEALLKAFNLPSTRKAKSDVADLLAKLQDQSDRYYTLSVSDCMAMTRDMKALLTVLMFSYELYGYQLCNLRALEINTKAGFSFYDDCIDNDSPYQEFVRHILRSDEDAFAAERKYEAESLRSVLRHYSELSDEDRWYLLDDLRKIAEHQITQFMSTAHPKLSLGEFSFKEDSGELADIYVYWAQLIAKGKAIACANCGKLVANARKGQIYCSRSCKVQASVAGRTKH